MIRYSVDIREAIPSIISRLQKVLSKRNLNFKQDFGDVTYDLLNTYKKELRKYSKPIQNKLEKPYITTNVINGKTVRGVECKFGLYINKNPIVERNFYVNEFNPASKFSFDAVDIVNDICGEIFEHLKSYDVIHMWEDYDLIKIYGLYIHQVRELKYKRRKELISNKDDISFVNGVKDNYRAQYRAQFKNRINN